MLACGVENAETGMAMATEPEAQASTPDETDAAAPVPTRGRADLAHVEVLAEKARDYARQAKAGNTRRAYESDWRHFTGWCVKTGVPALPADPQVVGLYITALASGASGSAKATSVATINRRLSALVWTYRQRGQFLDRGDRHIREVLAGIRQAHSRPPAQKEPVLGEDLLRMVDMLSPENLRGLRDRALLLLGFAGGLRRSEITGLDLGDDQSEDGTGWVEILDKGALLHIKGKTGWRVVEVARGSSDLSCPVEALRTWLKLARIDDGPVFRHVSRDGKRALDRRLTDRHVARLVQRTALAAGLRGDLPEGARRLLFGGHSLRAGLATSAEAEERHVQRQLGHASAEMTRRYQRNRDRFKVNLTKAAGL